MMRHLDADGTACELERRLRVADALRAAELMAGATDGLPNAKRSLKVSSQAVRLIGRLRRILPGSKVPVEPPVITSSESLSISSR